ncbi:MAG: hypothetical protein RI973_579 [Bacteroidota bacterium]|jgi:predicted Rossmann fold flavoprotein
MSSHHVEPVLDALIIGGGAAGFFAAITLSVCKPGSKIAILERGREVLQKVRISGGGRCNVTHACFEPAALVKNYPRGGQELRGPFHHFGPSDTVGWFQSRGVKLKTEEDGRMFPVTDNSETIAQCLLAAAAAGGVRILTGVNALELQAPSSPGGHWRISTQGGTAFHSRVVMVATGSSPRVWEMLAHLGHRIVSPVPSLFTFNIKDSRIAGLAGISVPAASVQVKGEKLSASGPLLVTHWGLSGPGILKLSAWGARLLHDLQYRFDIRINWLGQQPEAEVLSSLNELRQSLARKQVQASVPFATIPRRLWERLTAHAGISEGQRWADVGREPMRRLAQELAAGIYSVNGKSTFKEEFVTAGGVALEEVDFRRFESKLFPGLFLAGEVLDIDAVTGGFNFQAAWTGGYLAGKAMAGES